MEKKLAVHWPQLRLRLHVPAAPPEQRHKIKVHKSKRWQEENSKGGLVMSLAYIGGKFVNDKSHTHKIKNSLPGIS